MNFDDMEKIFPVTLSLLGNNAWKRLAETFKGNICNEIFYKTLSELQNHHIIPDYLPDLMKLEWKRYLVECKKNILSEPVTRIEINPTIEVFQSSYKFSHLFTSQTNSVDIFPPSIKEWIIIWKDFKTHETMVESASDEDLLALNIIANDMDVKDAAMIGNSCVIEIEKILKKAIRKGILFSPASYIHRDWKLLQSNLFISDEYLSVSVFTMQWHITGVCDLHCKHCYDSSNYKTMPLERGLDILNNLDEFCRKNNVEGHVCFTGGNPLLYPYFYELYKATVDYGFSTSILGNPVPREKIKRIFSIQNPAYFQVSLEGLPEYNDWIRGKGNYTKVIDFLGVLRDSGISSAVMLTLHKDNLTHVLPLAEKLRGHTDHFTFNRLSLIGEGKKLLLPTREEYIAFLLEYVEAAKSNPIMGIKDNLINIIYQKEKNGVFGGCTGYGCGAAFSFIAVLPNGEVHACRKFPSQIGNIYNQNLIDIYDSESASKYRKGSSACLACKLKPVCGGCMSIIHSYGLDIFNDCDPYCFVKEYK
jgi:selenobiotic family peptide radical SAM maturase